MAKYYNNGLKHGDDDIGIRFEEVWDGMILSANNTNGKAVLGIGKYIEA
jgi:hypothetical protein